MLLRIPPRYRFPTIAVLLYLVVETLERLVLLGLAYGQSHEHMGEMILALPVGTAQDFAMAMLLALPFFLLLHHFPGLLRRPWPRRLAYAMLLVLLGLLFFSNAAAVFFWNEFDSRFNSIAVNYLLFPREVIGNIQESFDLRIYLPPVIAVALATFWLLRSRLGAALDDRSRSGNGRFYALIAPASALAAGLVYAAPMEIGESRQANELANNDYYSFLRAAWTNDADYDGIYPGMDEARAVALSRALVAQDNTRFLTADGTRSLLRRVDNGEAPAKPLNVVLVINESFGSTFVDGLDNSRSEIISPNLTRLAEDGLLFTNIYSTGVRTVRGMEALLTSFTPIPGISTARRPGAQGMSSIAFLLKDFGYRSAFLYGGRAIFDNMRTYWSGIGYDEIWEQSDIEDIGFSTIWGAADEYIYGEALKRLDGMARGDKPFFLSMLSISNHRPYTYPLGRIDKDPADKRIENAATYADWAFGQFIEQARGRPWFDDTVFIFVADHGPRLSGSAQVPVERYRVPLLYYAPKHIKPARIDTVGSSMDMAPTLMGLLSLSFDSPFFGVDLLRVPKGKGRVAMSHNYSIAFAQGGKVATISPRSESRGYHMEMGEVPLAPTGAADPEVLEKAIAVTQTAHRMFYAGEYSWKTTRRLAQNVGN